MSTGFRCFPERLAMIEPMAVLPVKLTFLRMGEEINAEVTVEASSVGGKLCLRHQRAARLRGRLSPMTSKLLERLQNP
jgi:hypothetical protein